MQRLGRLALVAALFLSFSDALAQSRAQEVEAIEEGKVLPTAMADDQRGNPPPLLSLLQRQAHGVCQLAFARFQTITPVPSSAFSKKAARIGAAKLGSSSFTAR